MEHSPDAVKRLQTLRHALQVNDIGTADGEHLYEACGPFPVGTELYGCRIVKTGALIEVFGVVRATTLAKIEEWIDAYR